MLTKEDTKNVELSYSRGQINVIKPDIPICQRKIASSSLPVELTIFRYWLVVHVCSQMAQYVTPPLPRNIDLILSIHQGFSHEIWTCGPNVIKSPIF